MTWVIQKASSHCLSFPLMLDNMLSTMPAQSWLAWWWQGWRHRRMTAASWTRSLASLPGSSQVGRVQVADVWW